MSKLTTPTVATTLKRGRKVLLWVGVAAPIFLIALSLGVVLCHSLGILNGWAFPYPQITVLLVGISLLAFSLARILTPLIHRQLQKEEQLVSQLSVQNSPGDSQKNRSHWRSLTLRWIVGGMVALNLVILGLTYYMTHVVAPGEFGIGLPRQMNVTTPGDRGLPYRTEWIPVGKAGELETWLIPAQGNSRGTALFFHGHLGTKSRQLIGPAQSFRDRGFDSLLVDFQGTGESTGNRITIGMREAEDVAAALTYAQTHGYSAPYVLYGVSMGSAAVMRAIAEYGLTPDAIILELPFPSLLEAVKGRFSYLHLPSFPAAQLLVLWGGLHHGFNGFLHKPIDYARSITAPTLVFHGADDRWLSTEQVEAIVNNLQGPKQLVVIPDAGHVQAIAINPSLWQQSLSQFFSYL